MSHRPDLVELVLVVLRHLLRYWQTPVDPFHIRLVTLPTNNRNCTTLITVEVIITTKWTTPKFWDTEFLM